MVTHKRLTMIHYIGQLQPWLEWYLGLEIPAGFMNESFLKVNAIEILAMQKNRTFCVHRHLYAEERASKYHIVVVVPRVGD